MAGENMRGALEDTSLNEVKKKKSDHSGGEPGTGVKPAEVPSPAEDPKDAEDPKADDKEGKETDAEMGKKKKSATKVDMKVEDKTPTAKVPTTKAGMINNMLDNLKGLKKAELESIFPDLMKSFVQEDDDLGDNDSGDDAKKVVPGEEEEEVKPSNLKNKKDEDEDMQATESKRVSKKITKEDIDLKDDVEALFEGDEELSDEFKDKATLIFETAVVTKINKKLEEITQENDKELEEVTDKMKSNLTSSMETKVDEYLEYVVEEWMAENQLAIESGIRNELTEEFISGLKTLFEDHFIDIPESKVDVVEELGNKVDELESNLNREIETNIKLRKSNDDFAKSDVIADVCSGLVDTEIEKVTELAEGIDFENEEDYKQKLETVKENYFPSETREDGKVVTDNDIDGNPVDDEVLIADPTMARYSDAISRTVKH